MESNFNLNQYFDKIYCFCKPSNYENWNIYKNIYEYYNIDVKLIPAEDISSRVVNNVFKSWKDRNLLDESIDLNFIADSLSHTTFLNHAIDNNYNKILILKENIIPYKDYNLIINEVKIKNEWDFLIFSYNNEIFGYGITSKFYNDLLKLIKEFKLNFDEIINTYNGKYIIDILNYNLFFFYKKEYLNSNYFSLNSMLFKKNIFFVFYPFDQNILLTKEDNKNFIIYNQFDHHEWNIDFDYFLENIYQYLFTNKKIFIIGNSFCLKINKILDLFNNINFIIVKEKIENINNIDNYNYYPTIISRDDNFIENYYNFYYDYIDSISYKFLNNKNKIIYVEIDNFKLKDI